MNDTRAVFQNSDYLRTDQYRDSKNLNARAQLHRRFSTNQIGWLPWVFKLLDLRPGAQVLECGCGPGWLWRHNLASLPAGCQVILTDLSPGMVAEAETALSRTAHDFRFEVADIASLPYDDNHFDIVVANHMLYHVPDRQRAFAEVCRVLKPQGRFLAATNGEQHMQELGQMGMELFADRQTNRTAFDLLASASSAFGLENGRAQLETWFGEVALHLYQDSLDVSEVEPLLAYISSSSIAQANLTEEMRGQIREHIAQEIALRGAFHITKASGLFEALQPRRV
jgi:SAM-dependent methyltransferase